MTTRLNHFAYFTHFISCNWFFQLVTNEISNVILLTNAIKSITLIAFIINGVNINTQEIRPSLEIYNTF